MAKGSTIDKKALNFSKGRQSNWLYKESGLPLGTVWQIYNKSCNHWMSPKTPSLNRLNGNFDLKYSYIYIPQRFLVKVRGIELSFNDFLMLSNKAISNYTSQRMEKWEIIIILRLLKCPCQYFHSDYWIGCCTSVIFNTVWYCAQIPQFPMAETL